MFHAKVYVGSPHNCPDTRYKARKELIKAYKAMNDAGWHRQSPLYQRIVKNLKRLSYMRRGFNPRRCAGFWETVYGYWEED